MKNYLVIKFEDTMGDQYTEVRKIYPLTLQVRNGFLSFVTVGSTVGSTVGIAEESASGTTDPLSAEVNIHIQNTNLQNYSLHEKDPRT